MEAFEAITISGERAHIRAVGAARSSERRQVRSRWRLERRERGAAARPVEHARNAAGAAVRAARPRRAAAGGGREAGVDARLPLGAGERGHHAPAQGAEPAREHRGASGRDRAQALQGRRRCTIELSGTTAIRQARRRRAPDTGDPKEFPGARMPEIENVVALAGQAPYGACRYGSVVVERDAEIFAARGGCSFVVEASGAEHLGQGHRRRVAPPEHSPRAAPFIIRQRRQDGGAGIMDAGAARIAVGPRQAVTDAPEAASEPIQPADAVGAPGLHGSLCAAIETCTLAVDPTRMGACELARRQGHAAERGNADCEAQGSPESL